MRSSNVHMNNKFCASYPITNCDPSNFPSEDVKLGNYQQLEQLTGIRMTQANVTLIVELFSWSDVEVRQLTALKGAVSRNTLE